jgi:hypothetical protein
MFKKVGTPRASDVLLSGTPTPAGGSVVCADRRLDCSRFRNFFWWFVAGVALVIFVQTLTVCVHGQGHWTWLLHVSPEMPALRKHIEQELGPLGPLVPCGHDGQQFYAIARDPLGQRGTPDLVDQPRYRYQRILYPLLAGGGGFLPPRAVLWGLIVWSAVGAGLLLVGTADLCFHLGLQRWTVLLTLFNVGVLYSAVTLTTDILAAGLAIAGVSLWVRNRTTAAMALFALAALSREVSLLVPWSLALVAWLERVRFRAVFVAMLPTIPVAVWWIWLSFSMPEEGAGLQNLDLPGRGLVQGVGFWLGDNDAVGREDLFLGAMAAALMACATAAAVVSKHLLLRWQCASWVCLGLFASVHVWAKANNVLRLFILLWIFTILDLCWHMAHRSALALRKS